MFTIRKTSRMMREVARHTVVALSVVGVTFSGFLAPLAVASPEVAPEPLVARHAGPEQFILPASDDAPAAPYRVHELDGALAIELPSAAGRQLITFDRDQLSYGVFEHLGEPDTFALVASQTLVFEARTTATPLVTPASPSEAPSPTPEESAAPSETPAPGDDPTETETPTPTTEPTPTVEAPTPTPEVPTPTPEEEPTQTPEEEPTPTPEEPTATPEEPTPPPEEEPTAWLRGLFGTSAHAEGELDTWEPAFITSVSASYETTDSIVTVTQHFTAFFDDRIWSGSVRASFGFDGHAAVNKWTYSVDAAEGKIGPELRLSVHTTPAGEIERVPGDARYSYRVSVAEDALQSISLHSEDLEPVGAEVVIDEPLLQELASGSGTVEEEEPGTLSEVLSSITTWVEETFTDPEPRSFNLVFDVRDHNGPVDVSEDDGSLTALFRSDPDAPEGSAFFVDPSFGAEWADTGVTVQSGDGTQPTDFKMHFNPLLGGTVDELYLGDDFTTNRVAAPASESGGLTLVNPGDYRQAGSLATLTVVEQSAVRVIIQSDTLMTSGTSPVALSEQYAVYPSGRVVKKIVLDTAESLEATFSFNGATDGFDASYVDEEGFGQLQLGDGPDMLLYWENPNQLASSSYTETESGGSRNTTVIMPLDAGQHTFYQLVELTQSDLTLLDSAAYRRFADDYRQPDEPDVTRGIYLGFSSVLAAYQFEAINNVAVFRLDGSVIARIDPVFEVYNWSDPDLTAFKAQLNGFNLQEGVDYVIGFKNSDPSTGVLLFQYLHTIQQGDQFNVEGENLPPLFDLDPSDAAAIKRVQRGTVNFTGTQTSITLTTPVITSRSYALGGGAWGQGTSGTSAIPDDSRLTYWLASPTELRIIRNGSGTTASTSWEVVEFEDNSGAFVQRGSVSMAAATGTSNVTLPTVVNTAKAFPLISVRSSETTVADDDEEWTVRASLSATTLELSRNESATSGINVSWQVIQLDGMSVQRGLTDVTTPNNVTISSVNTAKSFVVANARAAAATAGIDNQYHFMAQLTGATTLALSKQSSTNTLQVAWYVVTFTGTSGNRVRSGTIADTILTKTSAAIAPTVVATRSFSLLTYQGAKGGTDDLSSLSFYSTLNSAGSSLAIGRDGGAGMASIAWQVSEFTKPAIQQNRYRWRNDDGTEVTATSAAAENASISMNIGNTYRLRFGLYNSDTGSATNQYRLEFARKAAGTACVSPTTTVVSAAGTSSFVVPTDVRSITVKAWGAGGGGGGGGSVSAGGTGAGGGFVTSTLTVIPGETLTVVVGGGGGAGTGKANSGDGGGGAGRSSVFRSTTPLVIAGGGAGAGGGDNSSATVGGAGGAGGGTSGVAGSASGTATGGGGGTASAGGAGGSNDVPISGGAGSSLQGGAGGTANAGGCTVGTTGGGGAAGSGGGGAGGTGDAQPNCSGGGGGGGGLFGGGGGGPSSQLNAGGGGGGGGSGFVSGAGTTLTAGSGATPAGTGDANYGGGAGVGGAGGATTTTGTAGTAGRVVIIYNTGQPTSPGWDWRQVPVAPAGASDSFDMVDSPNLTDAAATTNVAGLLTDDDTVFVPGEVKDTGSQTSSIGLASTSFTEIEYSIQANSNATVGGKYCFRLTDAGEDRSDRSFIFYPQYGQAEVLGAVTFTQNTMRWYSNVNSVTVTDPWAPVGGLNMLENEASISAHFASPDWTGRIRLRQSVLIGATTMPALSQAFKLQFAEVPVGSATCAGVVSWTDVGSSVSASVWRFGSNTAATDGTTLPSTVLSTSDVAGTYEEGNNTALNPSSVAAGQDIEYDFSLENNTADGGSMYCFRMVESDDTVFATYVRYPSIITPPAEHAVEKLMRHGNFFTDQGYEQPYFWSGI